MGHAASPVHSYLESGLMSYPSTSSVPTPYYPPPIEPIPNCPARVTSGAPTHAPQRILSGSDASRISIPPSRFNDDLQSEWEVSIAEIQAYQRRSASILSAMNVPLQLSMGIAGRRRDMSPRTRVSEVVADVVNEVTSPQPLSRQNAPLVSILKATGTDQFLRLGC